MGKWILAIVIAVVIAVAYMKSHDGNSQQAQIQSEHCSIAKLQNAINGTPLPADC